MFFVPLSSTNTRRHSINHVGKHLRNLDNLLSEVYANSHNSVSHRVEQDETHYNFSFDVPGVSKEQLSIGIEANTIRVETKPDAPRQYKLAYELPQDINVSASDAKLENGVLTLKLAKQVPVSKMAELTIH